MSIITTLAAIGPEQTRDLAGALLAIVLIVLVTMPRRRSRTPF